jgi:predicted transcriptional regulator
VDPDAHTQNKPFRDSLKMEYRDTTNLACCVVINMKDASPFIPNALIRKVAEKEVEGATVQLCYDFDRSLRKAWEMGEGVNNTCTVILVNARGEVLFSKLGTLTSQEKRTLRDLLDEIVRHG